MHDREGRVLDKLSHGPSVIVDIIHGMDLSYAQANVILRRLESTGQIAKLGKQGKNVIYARTAHEPVESIPFEAIIKQVAHGQTEVKIINVNLTPGHTLVGLQLASGEVLHAEILGGAIAGEAA
jgi:hypothetical protein